MKIVTVVGARPQFVKAAPVSRALLQAGHDLYLIHTGQHYDYIMSDVFFEQLGIPDPALNLGIGSGPHGRQTGQMLAGIEQALLEQKPDWVVVYGDTNSTLAGALAAVKLHIPVAHVEAGLRSFNRAMPEEHNRVLTDHCADLLLAPTQTAVDHLHNEGLREGVYLVGDTMVNASMMFGELAQQHSHILSTLNLAPKSYLLSTIHRPYNTDDPAAIHRIFTAFGAIGQPVLLPLHPRTRSFLAQYQTPVPPNVRIIEPVSYLDMLMLEQNALIILTDSGGIQKEAYNFAVPCITLRPETEWTETVQAGWNIIVGSDTEKIVAAVHHDWPTARPPRLNGDGEAAQKIAELLSAAQQG